MSNRTFACFDCRTTSRALASRIAVKCRKCRKPAHYVYYKFRMPGRRDDSGWRDLEKRVRPMNRDFQTDALRRIRLEVARIERLVEALSVSRRAVRPNLVQRLRELAEEREDWLKNP